MKAFFLGALMFVAILTAAFVGYGSYLNRRSAGYIASIQARKVIRVLGARVERRDMRKIADLGGIVLQAANLADVVSQIEGDIVEVRVVEGQGTREGETLCVLENTDLPLLYSGAQADVAKNESELSHAASSLERSQKLREGRAISESELEAVVAQAKMAEAQLAESRAALEQVRRRIELQNVMAPMDGEILVVYHKRGSHVPAGTPLMLMGDFSRLTFTMQMSSRQIDSLLPLADWYELTLDLRNALKAFQVNYSGGYEGDIAFEARITDVSPPLDEPAPFRQVKWSVANRQKILEPGLYGGAAVRCVEARKTLAAPVTAFNVADGGAVFVMDDNGRLAGRRVRIGGGDGRFMEILDGLKEGDIVVESGVDDLTPGEAIIVDIDTGEE